MHFVLLSFSKLDAEKQMLCRMQNIQLGLCYDVYALSVLKVIFHVVLARYVYHSARALGTYLQALSKTLLCVNQRMPFLQELPRKAM